MSLTDKSKKWNSFSYIPDNTPNDYPFQKQMSVVVLGDTANLQIQDLNCDQDETTFGAVTFTDVTLRIKAGNYAGAVLNISGNVILEQDDNAILGTVSLADGAKLYGNLTCDTIQSAGTSTILNSDLNIATAITGNFVFTNCNSDVALPNANANLTLRNCYINGNIGTVGGDLTVINTYIQGSIGNITLNVFIKNTLIDGALGTVGGNCDVATSKILAIGNITGSINMRDCDILTTIGTNGGTTFGTGGIYKCNIGIVMGGIGNCSGSLDIRNSYIRGTLGNILSALTLENTVINANIGTIGTNISMSSSTITGTIGVINNNVLMSYSSIGTISEIQGRLEVINSNINDIQSTATLLNINSKNSYIGISDLTANIYFDDQSDITIRALGLTTASQTLQLGDSGGGGVSGFSRCYIKIFAEDQGANTLTLADTATDTFNDNTIDLYFGAAFTVNLVGGATNILNEYGNTTAGITVTANNWTTNVLGY